METISGGELRYTHVMRFPGLPFIAAAWSGGCDSFRYCLHILYVSYTEAHTYTCYERDKQHSVNCMRERLILLGLATKSFL